MRSHRITVRLLQAWFIALLILSAAGCKGQQALRFPADHGPHFDSKNEWWYFTGVAAESDGAVLGFECTIFKVRSPGKNKFSFLGHVAISAPAQQEYVFSETLTKVPKITVTNFSFDYSDNQTIFIRGSGDNASVDLALFPHENALLHGRDGAIAMGDGLRSYYYSFTNLETSGTISCKGREYAIISGRTWMDHQWGNFTVFGLLWDWFSLRFDDGGALMLFHFRNIIGRTVSANWTYRSATGAVTRGSLCRIESSRTYTDATAGCTFPLDWTISIPELNAFFTVQPLFDNQAFYSAMTPDYWEGLCSFSGSVNGAPAAGSAYVELSGYCNPLKPGQGE
jgi:predicted secreted hydrolase